jgi:hypothetical protein
MQNMAMVNGKPSLEAKIVVGMINNSPIFDSRLDYEIIGTDPRWNKQANQPYDSNYRVRAYAKRKSDQKVLYGPWITWDMVQGEGWVQKDGSKWKTMPELMFQYRSASYFQKSHCPELTMGIPMTDEVIDITDYSVIPEQPVMRSASILRQFEEEPGVEAQSTHPEESQLGSLDKSKTSSGPKRTEAKQGSLLEEGKQQKLCDKCFEPLDEQGFCHSSSCPNAEP